MIRSLVIALCVFLFTLPVLAQATLQPTAPSPSASDLAAAVAQAQAAAAQSQQYSEDADRYADNSSRFFSLFESFGVVAALASVALGLYGATNVYSERRERKEERERFESELKDQRTRFDAEMTAQQQSMSALRQELLQRSDHQHKLAEQATLAFALLPLAERQYKAQDLKGAIESYQRALAFDADNP